jgi:hypothetical protein
MVAMPKFELDQESVSRAEKLSSRLMDDVRMISEQGPSSEWRREVFSEQRYSEEADGAPIDDVLINVNKMAMEFAIARRWDGEVPCLKLDDGGLAPISLTEFFGGPSSSYGSEDWVELWDRYIGGPFPPHRFWREILKRSGRQEEGIVATDVREAEVGFQRCLKDFLSYRFAGMKRWAEWIQGIGTDRLSFVSRLFRPRTPAVSPGGGLQVQVSCITLGLRVHISPAYFISWVYFGSPTSPVVSYVLPGRYIFSGDGPMLPKRKKDPTVFCIPPSYYPDIKGF